MLVVRTAGVLRMHPGGGALGESEAFVERSGRYEGVNYVDVWKKFTWVKG